MKIQLNEKEITEALVQYVTQQGVDTSGKEISVDFKAGRGENGHTADIDIQPANPGAEKICDKSCTDKKEEPAKASTEKKVAKAEPAPLKEVEKTDPLVAAAGAEGDKAVAEAGEDNATTDKTKPLFGKT